MRRTRITLAAGLFMIGFAAYPLDAQDLRLVVFGAAGVAHLYRAEDRSFGTEPSLGGGVGMEGKRFGLDLEVHRTLGLTPRPVPCAIRNVPCTGSAREGFLEAMMLSETSATSSEAPAYDPSWRAVSACSGPRASIL